MTILEQMCEFGHERVAFHQDPKTGLRAMIALHSSALGNALGGTRRWYYSGEADALNDVLRLSEGMTYKCACAGLPMGGGKSVIMLPKAGHPISEAEARAMGRFVNTFNGVYIAAEDVGVNIQFIDWMALETKHVMGGEKVSTGGDPSPFTARGVLNGMRAALRHIGVTDFTGLRVNIQGVGAVGSKLARHLVEAGATVRVADINQANLKRVVDELGVTAVSDAEILTGECDVLAPCALGGVIDANVARRLRCKIVCGGANNILGDPNEDAVVLKNRDIAYAPDFVVNAGGVIHLAGLYLGMTRAQLDRMIERIEETTAQILAEGSKASSTYEAAVSLAKRRIAAGPAAQQREMMHARS